MNQKIIIVGDTHGNFEIIEEIFQKENALGEVVAILHAGDIGVYDENSIGVLDEATGKYSGRMSQKEIKNILRHNDPIGEFLPYLKGEKKFPVPVYNIAGNHEDFDLYDDLLEGRIKVENFIPLKQNQVHTIDFGKQKLKIAGLGKIYPRSETSRFGRQHISEDEYSRSRKTLSSNKVDIFLLHEPPYLAKQNESSKWMSFGSPRITELIRDARPSKVFIGHMHFEYSYSFGQSELFGLGYGVVGRYAVIDSKLEVKYSALEETTIKIHPIRVGNEAYYLNEIRKKKVQEQRLEEKRIRHEMKKSPYDMNWLKTIFPIQIKSKEDKKNYAPLFLEISRMFFSKKSEEEIIQFAKKWMEGYYEIYSHNYTK